MIGKTMVMDAWQPRRAVVSVRQGEYGSRYLRIFLQYDGQPLDLRGAQVTLCCTAPDGTPMSVDCRVEDAGTGRVRLPFTARMCAHSGELGDVEMRVRSAEGRILKLYGLQVKVLSENEK
ncbi:MAG: BppU family phage baseplate upper protein [Clostridia bacterium]|nr:BppU family phage baseplate upper protein [Clostridia bacterium]